MIYLCPYNKRKVFLGDFMDLRSPSLVLLDTQSSGYFPNSSVSFVSYSDLNLLDRLDRFKLFFLDPEVVYTKNGDYLNLIKSKLSKNKNIDSLDIVSRSMSVNDIITFLKKVNLLKFLKDRRVIIEIDKFPKISGVMTNDKLLKITELLKELISKGKRRIVIVANSSSLKSLERMLRDHNINAKVYRYDYDENIKKRALIGFRSGDYDVLLVTKRFFYIYRGYLEPSAVVYLSLPLTFSDFFRDLSNFSKFDGYSGNIFVLLSEGDERGISRFIKKNNEFKDRVLEFLNFLFSNDKVNNLRNYYLRRFALSNLLNGVKIANLHIDDTNKFDNFTNKDTYGGHIINYIKGKYWEMKDIVNLLLGIDDSMMFYRGFGVMRGKGVDEIKNTVYDYTNMGSLSAIFFFQDGTLTKKFF